MSQILTMEDEPRPTLEQVQDSNHGYPVPGGPAPIEANARIRNRRALSPEPGMHSFEWLFKGPMHRWLLWDKQWMVRQLYVLREAGILSKVSEIDGMRQLTTKYALDDAVRHLVKLSEEEHP